MSAENASTAETAAPGGKSGGGATAALIVGVIGLIIGLAGLGYGVVSHESRFVQSWLVAIAFWLSIGIGMLFLIMVWYVFDAGWAVIIRRQLEHALAGMKWLLLLFVPLVAVSLIGGYPGILWKWMDPGYVLADGHTVAEDVLYQAKGGYLNTPFFLIRAALYFAVFVFLAEYLRKISFGMEKDGDVRWARRARFTSAFGIIACALATTFAAFDWFMSLEYHWFSTIYGVWYFASAIRAATAGAAVICIILLLKGPLEGGLFTRGHQYLLGCMLLAFTVFWAYIVFSQYFLIYNANIPEETYWYTMRLYAKTGGLSAWGWMLLGLTFFHFFFPFLVLLWYKTKVITNRLLFISVWILVFHYIDLFYNIVPRKKAVEMTAENPLGYVVSPPVVNGLDLLVDLGALVGIGGICVWAFLRSMKTVEVVPIRDPRIVEAIHVREASIHEHE